MRASALASVSDARSLESVGANLRDGGVIALESGAVGVVRLWRHRLVSVDLHPGTEQMG